MLTAIAIDDEPVALEVIKNHAGKIPFINLRACYTNALEAMDLLRKEQVDLLFLDIKMPDISGIEFLQAIPVKPMVIFTTAYSEHAVQSFELDAIDYLLKPFSLSRFLKACNKANEQHSLRNMQLDPETIFIKTGSEQVRVSMDEILYAESSGNYVQFVLANRKIISRLTMTEAMALLPAQLFVRIHRSFMAARKHIHKIEKDNVWVNKTALPIGATYADEVRKIIN